MGPEVVPAALVPGGPVGGPAVVILVVIGLLPAQAQWLQAAPSTARAAIAVSADTLDQVLAEVNRLRTEAGEPEVMWDPSLDPPRFSPWGRIPRSGAHDGDPRAATRGEVAQILRNLTR
ncbi:MAG: hypothetical protein ACYC33_07500 [Thermoleophilia bacterium]